MNGAELLESADKTQLSIAEPPTIPQIATEIGFEGTLRAFEAFEANQDVTEFGAICPDPRVGAISADSKDKNE